jgi:hypothetical protein
MKTRKLYSVRHHPSGLVFGCNVGHKARILPRVAALRIAKRLRRSGLEITCWPIIVNVTAGEAADLDRRYGKG